MRSGMGEIKPKLQIRGLFGDQTSGAREISRVAGTFWLGVSSKKTGSTWEGVGEHGFEVNGNVQERRPAGV